MYGYAEPAAQTETTVVPNEDTGAAATPDEQPDTAELRGEPVVQGVRPEISESAVIEPAVRRTPAHVPASAQEPQSVQEAERPAGSTVRPAGDGREEAVAEPAATATQARAAGQPSQDGFAGSLFDAFDTQTEPEPMLNVQQEPVLTLYDLFGFSAEERSQVNRPKKRGPKPKAQKQTAARPRKEPEEERFIEWREELMIARQKRLEAEQRAAAENPAPAGSAVRQDVSSASVSGKRAEAATPRNTAHGDEAAEDPLAPQPFKGERPEHYRDGTLIVDKESRVGYLSDLKTLRPMFHPLDLPEEQRVKMSLYIEVRDTYYHLYNVEADTLAPHPALRVMLNSLYDNFVERFGRLNEPQNIDRIRMDPGADEILSLERYTDGIVNKADIFDHPVAFSPVEIEKTDDVHTALAASMNRYADINIEYISELTGASEAEVLEQLKGRIYFNPDNGKYEIAERVIAGNVIEKANRAERFLDENPDHEGARETLAALREATPKPIAFEDLDFNFGERWIPTGIYDSYASWLFETEVKIGYIADLDEFGITAKDEYNIKIQNQYAVQGEFRRYTGLHLMKHALHNTIPDITKKARKLIDGEWREVKVRDGEKIQQANIKIDEIRSGFTDWLCDQSADFKEPSGRHI